MSEQSRESDLDAVMQACFHPTMRDRIGGRLALPQERANYPEVPDKVLMILFASRAGSTYAGHLLANTPYFQRVAESFNSVQLGKIRQEHCLSDDAQALRRMIADRGTPQAFAAKCGEPGLISAWKLGFLDAVIDRANFIMLKRRDILAQAVSLFRAELTGRFHSPQKATREVRVEDYDREKIATHLMIIEQVYGSLTAFLEQSGTAYRTVYYEDICADPADFVTETCADLGLAPPSEIDCQVRLKVLRDAVNEEWMNRFSNGD